MQDDHQRRHVGWRHPGYARGLTQCPRSNAAEFLPGLNRQLNGFRLIVEIPGNGHPLHALHPGDLGLLALDVSGVSGLDLKLTVQRRRNVADFRPYLDGFDHAFAEHPPLVPQDQRVEKVSNLKHPTYGYDLAGKVRFIGRAVVRWRELMLFPIAWDGEYVPVEWEEPAGHAGS